MFSWYIYSGHLYIKYKRNTTTCSIHILVCPPGGSLEVPKSKMRPHLAPGGSLVGPWGVPGGTQKQDAAASCSLGVPGGSLEGSWVPGGPWGSLEVPEARCRRILLPVGPWGVPGGSLEVPKSKMRPHLAPWGSLGGPWGSLGVLGGPR